VREAQRLRGIAIRRWASVPALVVPVLETGMEDALTLAESMDARGHGRGARSRYRPERWSVGSLATVAVSAAALVTFAAVGTGEPAVAAGPLAWPDVSWTRLASVLSLAFPAIVAEPGRVDTERPYRALNVHSAAGGPR
jgi:hypothetical protein